MALPDCPSRHGRGDLRDRGSRRVALTESSSASSKPAELSITTESRKVRLYSLKLLVGSWIGTPASRWKLQVQPSDSACA